jgi:predicted Holliday junction resolvase-like endonuclease
MALNLNFIMDFISKHTFITAFIIIGIFLIVKFLILPYLDVKGIKEEVKKTQDELQKTLKESLSTNDMFDNDMDMSMFNEGPEKRRKTSSRRVKR